VHLTGTLAGALMGMALGSLSSAAAAQSARPQTAWPGTDDAAQRLAIPERRFPGQHPEH
jgi:hypothetical protein